MTGLHVIMLNWAQEKGAIRFWRYDENANRLSVYFADDPSRARWFMGGDAIEAFVTGLAAGIGH